jgi:hypothetical protein
MRHDECRVRTEVLYINAGYNKIYYKFLMLEEEM